MSKYKKKQYNYEFVTGKDSKGNTKRKNRTYSLDLETQHLEKEVFDFYVKNGTYTKIDLYKHLLRLGKAEMKRTDEEGLKLQRYKDELQIIEQQQNQLKQKIEAIENSKEARQEKARLKYFKSIKSYVDEFIFKNNIIYKDEFKIDDFMKESHEKLYNIYIESDLISSGYPHCRFNPEKQEKQLKILMENYIEAGNLNLKLRDEN